MIPDGRLQFRILFRDAILRMVDLDLLSARGDMQNLLTQFAAVLAAFDFVVAVLRIPQYVAARLPHEKVVIMAWGDQEFLIATTMAIAGLFAVLAWNSILPERRDAYVLGSLPVHPWTVFRARTAAIMTALGISIIAINVFMGLVYPLWIIPPGAGAFGWLRTYAAYWLTMAAAGAFVCFALLALQGLAAQLLSYRLYLRVSSLLQLASFFTILGAYFLKPGLAYPAAITAPGNQRLLEWLPSYWFLGLFQELNGSTHPVFGWLAFRAACALALVFAVTVAAYTLAYRRLMRRIVEQPDIAPGDRSRPAARAARLLVDRLFAAPLDRAIVLFAARTMSRSRQHRLVLALYGGIALAIAAAYFKSALYGEARGQWFELNMLASLVLLFFAVTGVRAVYALPMDLRANWIFRTTAVHAPMEYFAAARKSVFALAAAPVWLASAALYFTIWPGTAAAGHLIVMALAGVALVYGFTREFHKIPFACSYVPGKTNLKVRLSFYGVVFLIAANLASALEFWAMQEPARFLKLVAVLSVAALWTWRQAASSDEWPDSQIVFEDASPEEMPVLNLMR